VAIGFVTAVGEVVGGVIVPAVSGILSDVVDESAFLWVAAALAIIGFLATFKLQEKVAT